MRYRNVTTKKLEDGKTVLETKIFLSIPKRDDDLYIIAQETDRLDSLANQFYDDPTMWWIIALANDINAGDIGIEPGKQLRIPRNIDSIQQYLEL